MTTYNPKSTYNVLQAIKCGGPTSCEAVGYHGNGGPNKITYPLTEFWNGKAWERQITYRTPPGGLNAVGCITVSHCEAVGYNQYSGETMALAWNGNRWTSQAMPKPPESTSDLLGISCYRAGCTAIGYECCKNTANGQNALTTVVFVYNGKKWTLQSPVGSADPAGAFGTYMKAIHCVSASSCTAVGYWITPAPPGYAGYNFYSLATTWNGSSWTTNNTPDPVTNSYGIYDDPLYALSCTSGGRVCTAVGSIAIRN